MDQTSRLQLARIVADALDPDHADPVSALRAAINDHANKLDTAGVFIHGPAADRPPPGVIDRFHYAEDTGVLTRDSGSAWESIKTSAIGGQVPVGGQLLYVGDDDPGDTGGGVFVIADGRLIDRTIYAGFFARANHKYNGGVDPGAGKVRIPDKRGRSSIGADNPAGARSVDPSTGLPYAAPGAAARLTTAAGHSNQAGQSGGEERHVLTRPELPSTLVWNDSDVGTLLAVDTGPQYGPRSGQIGNDTPHNVVHPYEVDNVIVRIA
jgi:hypothetical protein